MCGDFNEILTQNEKWGGRPINPTRSSLFRSCINYCNLIDLGFKGAKYTWTNSRINSNGLILERLDRCLDNTYLYHTSPTYILRSYSNSS